MALVFAIPPSGTTYGVAQSQSKTSTAEIAEARGSDGKVTDMKAYSKTHEGTLEALFNGDAIAEAGSELTVAGVTGLVTSSSVTESNTDYKRVSVTVQTKDAAVLSAYS